MIERKPDWLRVRIPAGSGYQEVRGILDKYHLNTVCDEAICPNRGQCFQSGTATFMILGRNCTRNCRFCNVTGATPEKVDAGEPLNVALAVRDLGLKYVVITSVTRDDLPDGGAGHFAGTVSEIRRINPETKVELLIPDFQGDRDALMKIIECNPDVLGHNIETVPSLYSRVRPEADYIQSLEVLSNAKEMGYTGKTKSGIMVGLGETESEVISVLKDLRKHNCDFLTVGQYLTPSKLHIPLVEYIHPDQFKKYKDKAYSMGFEYVASSPLVRSSYMAHEALEHTNT
ncbi:MAG: lipoyl synthase [Clostridia bacterium]|nr:lipoyl synthase [Clostridia bacterium]MBN2883441.1 lipoyl synthase [Clostridia bacterium]